MPLQNQTKPPITRASAAWTLTATPHPVACARAAYSAAGKTLSPQPTRKAGIAEQPVHLVGQSVAVDDDPRRAVLQKAQIGIAKVLDVAAGEDRRVEHRRLERILAALAGDRLAEKGDARKAQVKAHLAHRVAEQHVGVGIRHFAPGCGGRPAIRP